MSDDRIPPIIPPPIPPIIRGTPPVLVSVPPKRQNLSRGRRWARTLVWVVFALVIVTRLFIYQAPNRNRAPAGFFNFNQGNFNRRPPMEMNPPQSPVPADFWRFEIEIEPRDADRLRGYHWRGRGSDRDRPEVLVTVHEGGQTYQKVSMHLKGSAGSFRPFDDKPSVTLNFSKTVKDQKFHGYSKISLNNCNQDPSYICEIISRELFNAAGVPAPRAGHATMLINGRDRGIYVWTEGFGKGFLKRHFDNVKGNLYDGGFAQEIHTHLDVNSGDNPDDRSDLKKLIAAANERDPSKRWEDLNRVLDMDKFITFMVMEVMTCHWDGYSLNRNNTRIFHDLQSDKMIFIPHGMDQMFGVFRSSPSSEILPQMNGMVSRAVMSDPRGQKLYLEKMAALRKTVFQEEKLTERINELTAALRPTLEAYEPRLAQEHEDRVGRVRSRVLARAQSISEQLAGPIEVSFDRNGVYSVTNWVQEAKNNQNRTRIRFDRSRRGDSPALHIRIAGGNGAASWRSRLTLPPGRYRFEGRAWISPESRDAAAGLRISRAQGELYALEPDKWNQLEFPIDVRETGGSVQLVAEFRAVEGDVWFDQNAFRLIRED